MTKIIQSRNKREGFYFGRYKRATLNDPFFDSLPTKGSRHGRTKHKALCKAT